ncbi:DUF1566 domain-containing protein [Leptospira kmetyi]|uniref:Lcl C-terminal domain-containing protein n=1 Tax=Leptospira kmetyi TaxID=408139 RepID=UPI0003905AF1|nr:DUF1566 domain-containing protein [Leptospira kmetyi]EQA52612.1 PF07603 family protein [Leptospira kmetyi serovar Malaysia str. Bejo-Iso9]
MIRFRLLFFRIFLLCFLFLNVSCYLNPYFKDLVSPEKEEDSPIPALILLIAGTTPVIQGETIFFPLSGLTWMRCSRGQTYDAASDSCSGSLVAPQYCTTSDNQCNGSLGGTLSSGPAFDSCSTFSIAGRTMTWRVPTHAELKGLVYCSNGTDLANSKDNTKACSSTGAGFDVPTIRKDWFPGNPANNPIEFWSSTSDPVDPTIAWRVNFTTGITNTSIVKVSSGNIRCVSSR